VGEGAAGVVGEFGEERLRLGFGEGTHGLGAAGGLSCGGSVRCKLPSALRYMYCTLSS